MSIASKGQASGPSAATSHVYSICDFDRGFIVPAVTLIDARSDDEALEFALSSHRSTKREIWERHRLVAVIEGS